MFESVKLLGSYALRKVFLEKTNIGKYKKFIRTKGGTGNVIKERERRGLYLTANVKTKISIKRAQI